MKNGLIYIRDLFFSRSLSVADLWAISLIATISGWFWLALIPWIFFSVYMEKVVEGQ